MDEDDFGAYRPAKDGRLGNAKGQPALIIHVAGDGQARPLRRRNVEPFAPIEVDGNAVQRPRPGYRQASAVEFQGPPIDVNIDPLDHFAQGSARTVRARAIVAQRQGYPAPGHVVLPSKSFSPASAMAVVPELSLQWRKGESYVWLVREGKAAKVLVTSVRRRNSVVLIDGPVKPGDLVVVEGVQRLRDGRAVRYKPPPQPKSGADLPPKSSATKVKPAKG